MDAKEVLQECEKLTHNGRMQYMVELGRKARSDVSTQGVIVRLNEGDLYEQVLGLQSCHGTADAVPALKALQSSSRLLRARSLQSIALLAVDAQILEALAVAPSYLRLCLLEGLRKRKRMDAIDAHLEMLSLRKVANIEEYRLALPFASKAYIEKHLPEFFEEYEGGNLSHLTAFHALPVYSYLYNWVQEKVVFTEPERKRVTDLISSTDKLKLDEPALDLMLKVVRLLLEKGFKICNLYLQSLVQRKPNEMAELVIEYKQEKSLYFEVVACKLKTDLLIRLIQIQMMSLTSSVLKNLDSEIRVAVWKACGSAVYRYRSSDGLIVPNILGLLPTKERAEEVRKQLTFLIFETQPELQIPYAALLPWDEAMEIQTQYIRSADAGVRAQAICAQIASTKYQQSRLGDALQLVINRRNDQDPVRLQLLASLASLKKNRWREEDLEKLGEIANQTLESSDVSSGSISQLLQLVSGLTIYFPMWAAEHLSIIILNRGQVPYSIRAKKSESDIETRNIIFKGLLPMAKILQEQGKGDLLVSLARAFCRDDLKEYTEFLDILEEVLKVTRSEVTADGIVHLLDNQFDKPNRLDHLVPQLLESDPGWITLGGIKAHVDRHQLSQYYTLEGYAGRFSKPKPAIEHPIDEAFYRWTRTQQEVYAKERIAKDNTPYEVQQTAICLAQLCFIDPGQLISFASDERPLVRDTALKVLARLDGGQGVETLIEALGDERARVAIYSIRKVFKSMDDAEVLRILKQTSMKKVTVAKEVIRLVGGLKSESAFQHLLAVDKMDLHIDARIALIQALWAHQDRSETWTILKSAARNPSSNIPQFVCVTNADQNSIEQLSHLAEVFEILLAHPLAVVRIAALARCSSYTFKAYTTRLTNPIYKLLQSNLPEEVSGAMTALIHMFAETDPAVIKRAFGLFLHDRQTLMKLFHLYEHYVSRSKPATLPSTLAVLELLESDPMTPTLRLRLIFRALPWCELHVLIPGMAPTLHADALVKAEGLIQTLGHGVEEVEIEEVEKLEAELAGSESEGARRLAVAALVGLGSRRGMKGWTEERRGRLEVYRRDESVLVAEAASWVFPPE